MAGEDTAGRNSVTMTCSQRISPPRGEIELIVEFLFQKILHAKRDIIMNEHLEGCEHGEYEPHPCPFQDEMNGNTEDYCTCCAYCTEQCAMDV